MEPVDWGSVPAWVSAGATTAGFAWVILMFRLELRRRRLSYATPLTIFTVRPQSKIVLKNYGKYPYFDIDIIVDGKAVNHCHTLEADQEETYEFDAASFEDSDVGVDFADIRNQQWHRRIGEPPKPVKVRRLQ